MFPAWPFIGGVRVWHLWDSGHTDPEPSMSEDSLKTTANSSTQSCLLILGQRWFILCPSFPFPSVHRWRGKPGFAFAGVWHVARTEKSEGNSFTKMSFTQWNLKGKLVFPSGLVFRSKIHWRETPSSTKLYHFHICWEVKVLKTVWQIDIILMSLKVNLLNSKHWSTSDPLLGRLLLFVGRIDQIASL